MLYSKATRLGWLLLLYHLLQSIDKRIYREYNAKRYGPVAQLGAHHIRIVGVVGSNPIRSTKLNTAMVSDTKAVLLYFYKFYDTNV